MQVQAQVQVQVQAQVDLEQLQLVIMEKKAIMARIMVVQQTQLNGCEQQLEVNLEEIIPSTVQFLIHNSDVQTSNGLVTMLILMLSAKFFIFVKQTDDLMPSYVQMEQYLAKDYSFVFGGMISIAQLQLNITI